jgi:hypothetical protein
MQHLIILTHGVTRVGTLLTSGPVSWRHRTRKQDYLNVSCLEEDIQIVELVNRAYSLSVGQSAE